VNDALDREKNPSFRDLRSILSRVARCYNFETKNTNLGKF
jgi:hypothetical protein